nr:retrovirus-related Pol polyprotein from transposon TNT 1-94 [Tanacetum cinerariifolium]
MVMRLLVLISPIWSATTGTRGDILLGSAELQEIKTTSTRKAQEGVCLWKHLFLQLWCHVMVLVDMIGVIRQRKGQIMHSWLSHLQVLTQRLGHLNFNTMNKLVNGNLVRGLPSKLFENDQTCVACQKGKQHKASSRTPQQNRVAERRNMTLIEAAKTMLANFKLPTTFWAEAVNTACYVQNRVLVVKPRNETPYELFHGKTPTLSFMRPFGYPVTILNTIDHLGKFDGKADEGFFVGYSLNGKAFRVFNSRTRIAKEKLHIRFSESTSNIVGVDQIGYLILMH